SVTSRSMRFCFARTAHGSSRSVNPVLSSVMSSCFILASRNSLIPRHISSSKSEDVGCPCTQSRCFVRYRTNFAWFLLALVLFITFAMCVLDYSSRLVTLPFLFAEGAELCVLL